MATFSFGQTSLMRLATADEELQVLMRAVMRKQLMDFTILQGHRGEMEQNAAFDVGASKKRWPDSMHNRSPSLAIDIAPYPVRWGDSGNTRTKDTGRFYLLGGIVLTTAIELNLDIRWGGLWRRDGDVYTNTFDDLVHFELVRP